MMWTAWSGKTKLLCGRGHPAAEGETECACGAPVLRYADFTSAEIKAFHDDLWARFPKLMAALAD